MYNVQFYLFLVQQDHNPDKFFRMLAGQVWFFSVLSCFLITVDCVRNHLDHYDVARAVQSLEDGVRQCEVAR